MVTPKIKNSVLNHLVEKATDCKIKIDLQRLCSELDLDTQVLSVVLDQFHRRGLVQIIKIADNGIKSITLLAPAYDLYQAGGY